ncbi:predicted protein [Pseudomonas aeruginosa 2192]|nr:predicted protein [Pseudomonas aeruginosa 2192]
MSYGIRLRNAAGSILMELTRPIGAYGLPAVARRHHQRDDGDGAGF